MIHVKSFGYVYAYDVDNHIWLYDAKYYLKDGWWYWDGSEKKAFKCDEWQYKAMEKIMEENADFFKLIS